MFAPLEHSIIKRARDKELLKINLINFRDYSKDKHRRVDDYAFGGGAGLLLMPQPIADCIDAIDPNHRAWRVFLSPAAPVLTQNKVRELAKHDRLLLLCGHYEGVDQRVIDLYMDECISIGEYILTGGEIPAMVIADAVARNIPGVINAESLANESFNDSPPTWRGGGDSRRGGWEHPQYTRPRIFRGKSVPEVLINGNHADIKRWKDEN